MDAENPGGVEPGGGTAASPTEELNGLAPGSPPRDA